MPKKYKIDIMNGITTITFISAFGLDEAMEVIDKIKKDNSYHLRLWDFSKILFNFTMEEIQQIANYGKSKFTEKNRIALVAPQDLSFGTLRAFEVYRDQDAFSISRVFRTKQEAIKWLNEQKRSLASDLDKNCS